jgi:mercuric ion transport protein
MTCPCHLPILLVLLAGTGVASLVNEHVGLAVVVLSVLFVPALVLGLAALNRVDPERQGGTARLEQGDGAMRGLKGS